uniref:UPF0565 protein C2orf69 homolog n=1 Tax=Mesocestoides corti TaxID=53468 RepID=A0A5K3F1R5_MESCO
MACESSSFLVRLPGVEGRDHLTNDIFFSSCGSGPIVNIVFFGGDIQNEADIMRVRPENRCYADKWSYESVAQLLLSRLEGVCGVHLWIVRASRWLLQTFACYDNFMRCNESGAPDFSGVHSLRGCSTSAWLHLDALLQNAVTYVNGASTECPCAIIGFSKGACVVTQLTYELGLYVDLPVFLGIPLISRVISLTWLDAGHNGQTHLWPTWTVALSRLKYRPSIPKLFVFATPYELCDKNRPWNRRDFNTFLHILSTFNLPYHVETFYKGHRWDHLTEANSIPGAFCPTIESHFEILASFPVNLCVSTSSDS